MKASESYGLATIFCLCCVIFILVTYGLPDPSSKFFVLDILLLGISVGLGIFSAFCFLLMIGHEG